MMKDNTIFTNRISSASVLEQEVAQVGKPQMVKWNIFNIIWTLLSQINYF